MSYEHCVWSCHLFKYCTACGEDFDFYTHHVFLDALRQSAVAGVGAELGI